MSAVYLRGTRDMLEFHLYRIDVDDVYVYNPSFVFLIYPCTIDMCTRLFWCVSYAYI